MSVRPVKPRHAASLVLARRDRDTTRILMGKRPASAVFPELYVFPGGRVDKSDATVPTATALNARTLNDLRERGGCTPAMARACATAAIRETFEETGLLLAAPGDVETHNGVWAHFAKLGVAPAHDRLSFLGRAITPTSAPRRFHARFFLASADALQGELKGNGELSELDWYPIEDALRLPAVDVTTFVLKELQAAERGHTRDAPFFRYRRNRPLARAADA
ncbi:MAG: NUDIX domain-containing protein [Alphaproteobacteria bacterium]|nr:NUDIX domain-containing protein [Alphaproteobacteria bacterium]